MKKENLQPQAIHPHEPACAKPRPLGPDMVALVAEAMAKRADAIAAVEASSARVASEAKTLGAKLRTLAGTVGSACGSFAWDVLCVVVALKVAAVTAAPWTDLVKNILIVTSLAATLCACLFLVAFVGLTFWFTMRGLGRRLKAKGVGGDAGLSGGTSAR